MVALKIRVIMFVSPTVIQVRLHYPKRPGEIFAFPTDGGDIMNDSRRLASAANNWRSPIAVRLRPAYPDYQLPSAIILRRANSLSLASVPGKEPGCTSPSGT